MLVLLIKRILAILMLVYCCKAATNISNKLLVLVLRVLAYVAGQLNINYISTDTLSYWCCQQLIASDDIASIGIGHK